MEHLAVGVAPPCLQPLPPQAPQGALIETLREHPPPPGMVDGVQERREGRFHPPGIPAPWEVDSPGLHGIQGAHGRAVARAPAQEGLRVAGFQEACHGQGPALVFDGGAAQRPLWAIPCGPRGSSDEWGARPFLRQTRTKGVEIGGQGLRRGLGLPGSTPAAAACRMSGQPGVRQSAWRIPERVRHREPLCLAACGALPGGEGGMVGPLLPGRAMLPVPAPSSWPPLPPGSGAPVAAYEARR